MNNRNKSKMNRRTFFRYGIGAAGLLGCYSVFVERNIVQVNHYRLPVPGLPTSFSGYRIAHLTDLHLGALVSENFIAGVVSRANELRPDMVCLTGDYVHAREATKEIDTVWPLLQKLRAVDGVWAVLGNHDHWASTKRSMYWMERTGFGVRHSCRMIERGAERVTIGGAGDYYEDAPGIDTAFQQCDDDDCKILLAHNPDTVDVAFRATVALTLSGHTHGGQVKIPLAGAPVLPVKNKAYAEGFIQTPRTNLFISRGIGWAIMPVRLNCFPEIAVLELVSV